MKKYFHKLYTRIPAVSPFVLLVVALLIAGSTTAVALTVTEQADQMSIFTSKTTPSDIVAEDIESQPQGPNGMKVTADLRNTVNTTEQANVTVQLLDTNGTVIAEQTTVVELGAGETTTDRWLFRQQGLSEAYAEAYIIIDQS